MPELYQITPKRASILYAQAARETLLFEIYFLTEVGFDGPDNVVVSLDTLELLDAFLLRLSRYRFPLRVRLDVGGENGDWTDVSNEDLRFLREAYRRLFGYRQPLRRYESCAGSVAVQLAILSPPVPVNLPPTEPFVTEDGY